MKIIIKNRKRIYRIGIGLAVLMLLTICLGSFYKPRHYGEQTPIDSKEVSPYLTGIYSELHNNVQLGKPFWLVIPQAGINDIIAREDWPIEKGGVVYSMPLVSLPKNRLRLTAGVKFKWLHFVITAEIKPRLDNNGLLDLQLSKVKIGAVRLTLASKIAARNIFEKMEEEKKVNDTGMKIARSLLDDIAFDPEFKVNKRNVRITNIHILRGKLAVEISPAEQPGNSQ